jgi:hypothetical protein
MKGYIKALIFIAFPALWCGMVMFVVCIKGIMVGAKKKCMKLLLSLPLLKFITCHSQPTCEINHHEEDQIIYELSQKLIEKMTEFGEVGLSTVHAKDFRLIMKKLKARKTRFQPSFRKQLEASIKALDRYQAAKEATWLSIRYPNKKRFPEEIENQKSTRRFAFQLSLVSGFLFPVLMYLGLTGSMYFIEKLKEVLVQYSNHNPGCPKKPRCCVVS